MEGLGRRKHEELPPVESSGMSECPPPRPHGPAEYHSSGERQGLIEAHLHCGLVSRRPESSRCVGFRAACRHLPTLPWTPPALPSRRVSASGLQGPGLLLLDCEDSQMGQCWLQCLSRGLSWEASVKHDLGQLVPSQGPSHEWVRCFCGEGPRKG